MVSVSNSSSNQNGKSPSGSPEKNFVDAPAMNSCKKRKTGRKKLDLDSEKDSNDEIKINVNELENLWKELTERTENCSLESLLDCHSMLFRIIFKYQNVWDRSELIEVRN